jgi:hypothetical protein
VVRAKTAIDRMPIEWTVHQNATVNSAMMRDALAAAIDQPAACASIRATWTPASRGP